MRRRGMAFVFVLQTGAGARRSAMWNGGGFTRSEKAAFHGDDGILTSETLTRPSWKEQSLAFWVHTWRYLHQWQGKEPFTHERQLKHRDTGLNRRRHPSGWSPFPLR